MIVWIVFIAIMIFQDIPLTATMLLWINVVTDGIPAVALGLDKPEEGIMKHSPRVFQSHILSKRHWIEMFFIGFSITIATLAIYIINLPNGVLEAKNAAFTAIVVFELLHIFLIRSTYKISPFSNKWLWIAVLTTVILQLIVIYVPPVSKMFELGEFMNINWLYIIVGCFGVTLLFKSFPYIIDLFAKEK